MLSNQFIIVIGVIVFVIIVWNLRISTRIVEELKRRNIKARIAHRRGLIFRYLKIYKELTVKETGKPGPLYFQFLWTFYLYMFLLLIGIVYIFLIK